MRRLPIALILLFSLIAPLALSAQTTFGLAPGMVTQEFKPGQPFQVELSVTNGTDTAIEMRSAVTDFWYDAQNQKTFGPPGQQKNSAANWIEMVPKRFAVPAHGTAKVTAIITPPAQASGGYYAAIFVESKPELTQQATSEHKAVFTNVRLGSLVMLTAKDTASVKVNVSDYALKPPTASSNLELTADVQNQSNVHVFAQPYLAIFNANKELLGKVEGETKRFLPSQHDRLSVKFNGALPPGKYQAVLAIAYGDGRVVSKDFVFDTSDSR